MQLEIPTMKSQGAAKNEANNAAQAAAPVVEEEVIDFSKVQIEPLLLIPLILKPSLRAISEL